MYVYVYVVYMFVLSLLLSIGIEKSIVLTVSKVKYSVVSYQTENTRYRPPLLHKKYFGTKNLNVLSPALCVCRVHGEGVIAMAIGQPTFPKIMLPKSLDCDSAGRILCHRWQKPFY